MPEISVVMSTYNTGKWLSLCIESILSQSFEDFEFIIVDDGSTDDSAAILADYQRRDPRIHVISQENQGLTRSLNIALSRARGRYIARQDADDLSLPNRFEVQLAFLGSHPDIVLIGSDATAIDEQGEELVTVRNSRKSNLRRQLKRHNLFVHGSIMFRRVIDGESIVYDNFYLKGQDYDLLLRMSELGDISIVPEVLYQWRMSRSAIVGTNVNVYGERARANHLLRLAGEPEDYTPFTQDEITPRPSEGSWQINMGIRYLSGYCTAKARKSFLEAISHYRYSQQDYWRCLKFIAITYLPQSLLRFIRER